MLADWLVNEAWRALPEALTARLGEALNRAGIPVWRIQAGLRTLHPQLVGENHTWRSDGEAIETRLGTRESVTSEAFLRSPLAPLFEGAGAIRRRLAGEGALLDYPILRELAEAGATDYVALPMTFSTGQVNAMSFATRDPAGFATDHLSRISGAAPLVGRLYEIHLARSGARALLETYLGRRSGGRVLDGLIQRGDGEEVEAAIWLADLRGSTRMIATLARGLYLDLLNTFFDATAGPVSEQGGEVLKFMGDAVLAIFPAEDGFAEATARALAAGRAALARLDGLNEHRGPDRPALRAAIALHLGPVTLGNVGTADRLDFTAIGPAVNETARLAEVCKAAGRSLIASEAFAAHQPQALAPAGEVALRDVSESARVYAPA